MFLCVNGTHVGTPGPVNISVEGMKVGTIPAQANRAMFPWNQSTLPKVPPRVTFRFADEGTWFVPERVQLVARHEDHTGQRLCWWQSGMSVASTGPAADVCLSLIWSTAPLNAGTARFLVRDTLPKGHWQGQFGAQGAWIPNVTGGDSAQNGWRLEIQNGRPHAWSQPANADPRILLPPNAGHPVIPTCWFADDHLAFRLVAPADQPYQLTLYCLDYDRNGRAMDVILSDDLSVLDTQRIQTTETASGICLKWAARGSVNLEVRKVAGFNVVLSGIFVDPQPNNGKQP